jgi:DNA-binding Xre family transcriptional regulator
MITVIAMTKTSVLKARMVLHGYTIKSLAAEIGCGEQNLSLKINGKRKFNQVELARIMKALHLTPEELLSIFLEEDELHVG